MCALNCNSISNYDRRIALSELVRASGASICFLSETKLKQEQHPRFLGFKSFYQSNILPRGGTAILVDDTYPTLNFRTLNGPIEATYIEIKYKQYLYRLLCHIHQLPWCTIT